MSARELANDRAMANAERAWLEPPDDRRPNGVEDVEDMVIFMPGVFEPGTTVEEMLADWEEMPDDLFGIVDGWDSWEEAERDEDGCVARYGGVTLQVQSLTSKLTGSVELGNVEEYIVPEGPLRAMGEAAEKVYKAEAAARAARRVYDRCWPFIRKQLADAQ